MSVQDIRNRSSIIAPVKTLRTGKSWAIILAGGDAAKNSSPRSDRRNHRPKHFCRTPGSDFIINRTRNIVARAFPTKNILFAVTENHLRYCEDAMEEVPRGNLIVEPQDDGTTFAILYSLLRLAKQDPKASVAFFPADFSPRDAEGFMTQVEDALSLVKQQPALILIGVVPDSPDKNREWIEPDPSSPFNENLTALRVRSFRENVTKDEARELMRTGGLLHSSVLVGTVSTFLRKIRRAAPEIYAAFADAETKIGTPAERVAMKRIYYGKFAETDFSRDVLAKSAKQLAVIPVAAPKAHGIGKKPPVVSASPEAFAPAFQSMAAAASSGAEKSGNQKSGHYRI